MEAIAKAVTQWIGTPQSIVAHTIFFTIMLLWCAFDPSRRDHILLVLTTIVSLEAIYQMLFLQLTVNLQGRELTQVKSAMEEVHETVEEMQETVGEVQETVGEVHETVEEMQETVGEVQETVGDIQQTQEEEVSPTGPSGEVKCQ